MKKHGRPMLPAGFTIVELMVYVSIVVVAFIVFAAFATDVTKAAARSRTHREVQQNARLILDRLTREVRNGTNTAIGSDCAVSPVVTCTLTLTNALGTAVGYRWNNAAQSVEYDSGGGTFAQFTASTVRVTDLTFAKVSNAITIALVVEQGASSNAPSRLELASTVVSHRESY